MLVVCLLRLEVNPLENAVLPSLLFDQSFADAPSAVLVLLDKDALPDIGIFMTGRMSAFITARSHKIKSVIARYIFC